MTRRRMIGGAIFGATALGIAGLAAAGYFAVGKDDDDDDDEGREANELNENVRQPAPNYAPPPQPPTGTPQ